MLDMIVHLVLINAVHNVDLEAFESTPIHTLFLSIYSAAALGLFYLDGQGGGGGTNKDSENGLSWLKRSSASGCIHGTGLLALQYYTKKLFSKAAETAFK